MQRHTALYLKFFDYGEHQDVRVPCQVPGCIRDCTEVHHAIARGMGGSKTKDYIENLIGLCRTHHEKAHASPEFNEQLKKLHLEFIREHRPDYEIQEQ